MQPGTQQHARHRRRLVARQQRRDQGNEDVVRLAGHAGIDPRSPLHVGRTHRPVELGAAKQGDDIRVALLELPRQRDRGDILLEGRREADHQRGTRGKLLGELGDEGRHGGHPDVAQLRRRHARRLLDVGEDLGKVALKQIALVHFVAEGGISEQPFADQDATVMRERVVERAADRLGEGGVGVNAPAGYIGPGRQCLQQPQLH